MRRFGWIVLFCYAFFSFSNADSLATILETKKIRVCIWPEYYSISYVNPRTQQLAGIDVDLAYEFAASLNAQPQFVPSSFATLIHDLSTHQCDIAMFGIGHTKERAANLLLTSPHLASDIYAIASKSNRRIQTWEDIDQEGVIVAVAKGTYHVGVMQSSLKKAKLLIVDSMYAREQEVQAGRADVFMTDYPFGMRFINETDWAKLITPSTPFHKTFYGWALALDEPALYEKAQAFMAQIKKDGRLLQAAKRYRLDPIVVTDTP
jgi:ABC-type amino acid transport substrate-binding protein